jgi:hypothetical protein
MRADLQEQWAVLPVSRINLLQTRAGQRQNRLIFQNLTLALLIEILLNRL